MDSQENVADQYDVSAKLISHLVVLSLDICMGVFQIDPMNSSVVAKTCFGWGFFARSKIPNCNYESTFVPNLKKHPEGVPEMIYSRE